MALGRQAKILSKAQVEAVLGYLTKTRHHHRNRVILLLSVRAGMRAKEIASLTWEMLTDPEGDIGNAIHLQNKASKGKTGGRVIPMASDLRQAIATYRASLQPVRQPSFVIGTERGDRTSPQVIANLFGRWYRDLGFNGCSSHSGRRTFITNAARRISSVGGSLRDVQMLAGHSNLATTQRYIEANGKAQQRVVDLI